MNRSGYKSANRSFVLVVLGALTSVSVNKYSAGIFIFYSFIACFYTTCLIFCCFDWWVLSFTKYFISLFLTSELERNTTLENFNIFSPFFVSYFTLPFPFLSIFLFFYLCIFRSLSLAIFLSLFFHTEVQHRL